MTRAAPVGASRRPSLPDQRLRRRPYRPVRERELEQRLRADLDAVARAVAARGSGRRRPPPGRRSARAGGRRTRPRGRRATPLTRRSRTRRRAATYSQSPTPPACGQTGTPNLAASRTIASTSFTPARRQQSSWQTSMAPSLQQLLEDDAVLRVLAGRDADRRDRLRGSRAWPSTSSGLVGSSIQNGSNSARTRIASIASSTPQT